MNDIPHITVAKAFLRARDTGRYCFELRPHDDPFGGRLAFPGGGIDEGETPNDAMERELFEELNIHTKAVEIDVQTYDVTHDDGSRAFVTLHYFVAEIEKESDATPGSECEAIEWHAFGDLPEDRMVKGNAAYMRTHRSKIENTKIPD